MHAWLTDDHGTCTCVAIPTTVAPWDRADEVWLEPATKLVLERS